MRLTHALALAAALGLVSACRDASTGTDRSADVLTADVAIVAGDAAYDDVGMIYSQTGTFGVPTGQLGRMAGFASMCPYDAATGRFTCPVMTRDGHTMERSYAFADATGAAQNAYDPSTTESANFRSTMTGAVARDGWSATISSTRDMTQSGLAGTETTHVINGTGSSTQSRSQHTDGGVRTYTMSSVATFSNVVIPFPRARGLWPLSGSITRHVTAARDDGTSPATHVRTATTSFNGTRFATLTVGERTFRLDLATGRVVRDR